MTLRRWEPWEEMRHMHRVLDRFMDAGPFRPWRAFAFPWSEGRWLPLDVYHTEEAVVVKAALPGIKPEDVEITVTGNSVTISGESKAEESIEEKDYVFQEHRYGSFQRTITLPDGLDTEKAEATFENGVLKLRVPRLEEARPKTIKVKTA
ncbi:MAG: Hsp20/alpha crystallin family protein [Chloroflexi bacterium]|nr:Hsp20/alpha crystallin family protein [Chloroflexota bacterium]